MKIIDIYNKYKEKYPHYVILIPSGNFYETRHEDAEIIHSILGYQIKNDKIGFPKKTLGKVELSLEKNKISYLIIEKNQLEIDIAYKKRFNNNNFSDRKESSELEIPLKAKLDSIYQFLSEKIGKDDKVEFLIEQIGKLVHSDGR